MSAPFIRVGVGGHSVYVFYVTILPTQNQITNYLIYKKHIIFIIRDPACRVLLY